MKTLDLKIRIFDQLIFLLTLLFSFLLHCAIERWSSLVVTWNLAQEDKETASSWNFFKLSSMKKLEKKGNIIITWITDKEIRLKKLI